MNVSIGLLSVLTALIGLIGGLVGATLTYWLGIRGEAAKGYQKLRTEAYIQFIEAATAVAIGQRTEDAPKTNEALRLLSEAKSKIAVYGSRKVVALIADFFRKYGVLNSNASCASFAYIIALMRSETPGRPETVPLNDMLQLLFGSEE
jgi:hypothetical protein